MGHVQKNSGSGSVRFFVYLLVFIGCITLGCSRVYSWSSSSGHALGPVVALRSSIEALSADESPGAQTASSTLGPDSTGSSSSSPSTPVVDPAWANHIIFNGTQGRLDSCPQESSSWSEGMWIQPTGAEYTGGTMYPDTHLVQQAIWDHQHPADCSQAKFLLYSHPSMGEGTHGVGSLLHLETHMLLLALNSGRVLVEIPGTYLTDHPYCGTRNTVDTCYFLPLTHCQVTPEQIASAQLLNGTDREHQALFNPENKAKLDGMPRFLKMRKLFPQKNKLVHTAPLMFADLIKETGISQSYAYYWWRAQALTYIVRPNQQALEELAARKREKLRGRDLAPGCVSVYIRHGDKHTEHQTYEDPQYEEALQHLLQVDPSLTRQVFLSTEDPYTVTYFTNTSRNWDTTYVDMPRKPDRKKNNIVYMKENGFAEEMLDGLLNLDLALQCDGFVGSINSNWARMIDELRSTMRCKAHKKYMDVGIRAPTGFYFWF